MAVVLLAIILFATLVQKIVFRGIYGQEED
jgi:hypothetical protein